MKVKVFDNSNELNEYAANCFKSVIESKTNPVLGFATGSTPIGMYNKLIEMNKVKELSFKNVVSFNLDEYCGIEQTHDQSYFYFMHDNLFKHIDISLDNVNLPSGTGDLQLAAKKYNEKLSENIIDIQILGIGRNGHIAFNEPGTSFDSVTHVVTLDEDTRDANARFFDSIDDVPKSAITMGLKNIMDSKKIILIAMGKDKASAVKSLIEGEINENFPCSILQKHDNVEILLDKESSSLLS